MLGPFEYVAIHLAKVQINFDSQVTVAHVAGICYDITHIASSLHCWILDYGVSTYICFVLEMFDSIKPVSRMFVSLANQTHVNVEFVDDI